MRKTLYGFLMLALMLAPLAAEVRGEDSWTMADLWPFSNAADAEADAPAEASAPTVTLPKLTMPKLWTPTKIESPRLTPNTLMQSWESFNSATRRLWNSSTAFLNPFSREADAGSQLYDDRATVGSFMMQPRLDP